jgi:RecJ-like exonuclease
MTCPKCDGAGETRPGVTCAKCEGTGRVLGVCDDCGDPCDLTEDLCSACRADTAEEEGVTQ